MVHDVRGIGTHFVCCAQGCEIFGFLFFQILQPSLVTALSCAKKMIPATQITELLERGLMLQVPQATNVTTTWTPKVTQTSQTSCPTSRLSTEVAAWFASARASTLTSADSAEDADSVEDLRGGGSFACNKKTKPNSDLVSNSQEYFGKTTKTSDAMTCERSSEGTI
jgi:hypothetical protein